MALLEKINKNIIEKIEKSPATLWQFAGTFLFFLMLRNLIEFFSDQGAITYDLVHYNVSYIALGLVLVCVAYAATKENIINVIKSVSLGFFILVVVPIIDLIFSRGQGSDIAYLFPEINGEKLWPLFYSFFGPIGLPGASIGIRIELILAIIAFFIYFLIKTKKIWRSAIYSFLIYIVFFVYGCLPYFFTPIFQMFGVESAGDRLDATSFSAFVSFFMIVVAICSVVIARVINRHYFDIIFRDGRWLRQLNYFFMFFGGIMLITLPNYSPFVPELNLENILKIVLALISISTALFFSLFTNNIYDIKIDEVSNPDRPTVGNIIALSEYKKISIWFLVFSLVFAAETSFPFLFFIVLLELSYFVYSCPPLRVKRWTILSKFFIGINCLITVFAGYVIFQPLPAHFVFLPKSVIAFFLIFFSLAANIIDIKDYEGDKLAGIKTLPVVMGLRNSKILIGLLVFASHIAAYYLFAMPYYNLTFLFIIGVIQFFIINRKKYSEKPFFLLYLLTIFWIISQIK